MNPENVRAVLAMPRSTAVYGVRRIVGFVAYLSKFLPKLSDICEPLRKLTFKDTEFWWLENHDNALNEIKRLVTSEPVLKYYDPKLQLTLQSNGSETDLAAATLQANQPIAYASRAVTDTETRYAQIEKELLSVVFGLQKVYVTSDHKQLESILKKPLHCAPTRLQRMMLQLQKYNIQLVCKSGREMYRVDILSRAYVEIRDNETVSEEIEAINMIKDLAITEQRLKEIQQHTESDTQLQKLKHVIQIGWPEMKYGVSHDTSIYFDVRDELTVQNGLIFKGERVAIPKTLRLDMTRKKYLPPTLELKDV
jgi:hypothetical protein